MDKSYEYMIIGQLYANLHQMQEMHNKLTAALKKANDELAVYREAASKAKINGSEGEG